MPTLPVGTPPVQVARAAPAQAPAPTAQAAPEAPRTDRFDSNRQPQAVVTQPGHRPADGLRAYEELAPKQQALLGEDGAERYAALEPKERAAFIVLTTRMEQNKLDTTGLKLKPQSEEGIQQDRLLFEAEPKEAVARLQGQVRDAVARGEFVEDKPSGGLHGSGMSDYGARQWVTRESMQLGFGPDGLFVDIDRFGVKTDLVGLFGHMGELLDKGKTDPFQVGKSLHIDVASHLPPAGK